MSDKVEFEEIVAKLQGRIRSHREFITPSGCMEEQKHCIEDTSERVYWHYGYMVALRDVLRLFGVETSNGEAAAK